MIPMILMAFIVAGLVITGSIAAGSAFLAQRDLQSTCDGAAIAGAQALSDKGYYGGGLGAALPLEQVQDAVNTYIGRDGANAHYVVDAVAGVRADGVTVTVACNDHVHIPFEHVYSPGGLDRTTTANARSPVVAG